jgi:hypothetical protein
MPVENTKPRVGRRGRVWKQATLSPDQDATLRDLMRKKRWTFQTLAEEAFKTYCLGQGVRWPESDDPASEEIRARAS